jgi:hypothetical protein
VIPVQKSIPFTISTAQATPQWECADYPWVSVHVLTQGGSSTITFQTSNNGVDWVSTALSLSSATASAPVTSTTSASAIYAGPLAGRFFRLNVTGIASGVTSGVVAFLPTPRALSSAGGTATISGDVASGSTDSGNPVKVAGVYNTTLPTLTNGQRGDVQLDVNGNVRAKLYGSSSAGIDAVSNAVLVSAQNGASSSENAVRPMTSAPFVFNGTSWDRNPGNTSGAFAQGPVAHDAAIAGNPNRIGFRALTANYTAVATGDTADAACTLVGAQVTKPYSIPEADWSYAAAASGIVNTTTAVTIRAAGAAGIRSYVTSIQIMAETLGTATELAIRNGAGGTVLWRTKIGTGGLTTGQSITFPSPLESTAATLLEVVTLTASGTGAVYFNAQGYQAP